MKGNVLLKRTLIKYNHHLLIVSREAFPPTRLVFVPVGEGQRWRRAVQRKPAVLSLVVPVREADPVISATVGSTRTQQTVDKSLFKPVNRTKTQ